MIRSTAIRLAAYFAIAYLAVGGYFYFRQSRLLFPAPKAFEKETPANNGLPFEDLRIAVSRKDYLHAWWIPAATTSSKAILVFHGNGYVLEDMTSEVANLQGIGANLCWSTIAGMGPARRSGRARND